MTRPARNRCLAVAISLVAITTGVAAAPTDSSVGHTGGPLVPATRRVRFAVALRYDMAHLEADLRAKAPPIDARGLAETYGPSLGAVRSAARYLERRGFGVGAIAVDRSEFTVDGTAGAIAATFHVRLHADPRGAHFPVSVPVIPRRIAGIVTEVLDLDTRPVDRPRLAGPQTDTPQSSGRVNLNPAQLRAAFDAAGLGTGAGQTVGIVSLAELHGNEVQHFEQQYQLPIHPVDTIKVGRKRARGAPGDDQEVALDLETVEAMAPGARIVDYETYNADGIRHAMKRIVDDTSRLTAVHPKIVSISWGQCETFYSGSSKYLANVDAVFARAERAGITVFAASGDDGAADCARAKDLSPEERAQPAVDYPASSPHVFAVGGTTLTTGADGSYHSERAWWDGIDNAGTGGGHSNLFPRPSWQQLQLGTATPLPGSGRLVPDVAGPADANGSMLRVVLWENGDASSQRGYYLEPMGGTSAAAPFWAGALALIREHLAAAGYGELPPETLRGALYRLAGRDLNAVVDYVTTFHDVVDSSSPQLTGGLGYDTTTGMGTPRVGPLAELLLRTFEDVR